MCERSSAAPAPAIAPRRRFSMSFTRIPCIDTGRLHSDRLRLIAGVFVWLAIAGATSRATTVVPMSFSELVTESTTIVYGRVAGVHGLWTDDRRSIESVVTLDVMTSFKGSPGPTMTFTIPGGQSGRFASVIPGVPTFTQGDL